MIKKAFFQLLLLVALVSSLCGQENLLQNGSFEDTAKEGTLDTTPIRGWSNCGFKGESAPDIHPVRNGQFAVTTPSFDGLTYLGLVVRDNGTYESLGQELLAPLLPKEKYELIIYLARSENYRSISRKLNTAANYTTPAILRIWGGNAPCEKGELLATSEAITHHQWQKYVFPIQPNTNWNYIIFEAYYNEHLAGFAYNGNLLLDNANLAQVDEFGNDNLTDEGGIKKPSKNSLDYLLESVNECSLTRLDNGESLPKYSKTLYYTQLFQEEIVGQNLEAWCIDHISDFLNYQDAFYRLGMLELEKTLVEGARIVACLS